MESKHMKISLVVLFCLLVVSAMSVVVLKYRLQQADTQYNELQETCVEGMNHVIDAANACSYYVYQKTDGEVDFGYLPTVEEAAT